MSAGATRFIEVALANRLIVSLLWCNGEELLSMPGPTSLAVHESNTRVSLTSHAFMNPTWRIGRPILAAIFTFLSMMPGLVGQSRLQDRKIPVPFRDSLFERTVPPHMDGRTNRYVSSSGSDESEGTKEHPWATISHAGSMALPGTTVHVAPGNYVEAVVTLASGTAAARIIYVSDEDWGAVILAPGKDGFAWKNTGSYTDIIGFEIVGSRCGGIGLGGSSQRAISNHVHNSAAGCSTSDGGSGINDFNYLTQGNDILRNYVHDVGSGEPQCGQLHHNYIQGIYQANAGGHIDHNIVVNSCGFGIHLWHAATHATITNNTVIENKAGGILVGSGDAPCSTSGCPGGNDYTIVSSNLVAFNGNETSGGWGLGETSQEPGRTGIHNEYSHNLSFRNFTGDFYLPKSIPCKECVVGIDPRFVSVSAGDYRLAAGSPAIGAGKILNIDEKPTKVSKGSRPQLDIGALPPARGSNPQ
jgi:hypothetical protein